MRKHLFFTLIILFIFVPTILHSQTTKIIDPEILYDRAVTSLDQGNYSAAIADLKELKHQFTMDLIIRSKLVVAYDNIGDTKQRDQERLELIQVHSTSTDPKISSVEAFERDYFHLGKQPISCIEYFNLVGDRPIRYSFLVLDTSGNTTQRRITLGSYERTNSFLRQRGEIKPNERAFHLDEETPAGHTTWGMFVSEPSSDEVKAIIISILKGETKPLSQSTVAKPK
jgi:hypothetical protein